MTSEIEAVPSIMKVLERSYSTPPGWRLATVEEARHNLEMIEIQGLLMEGERARLLDGWISGSYFNCQIGDDFKIFLGYMLVIQVQTSENYISGNSDLTRSIYSDVTLTDRGRDVALFLCAYDWNYEVVYWLLNSWENRDTLNLLDVRQGRIPLKNGARFVEMNKMICHLCRILGEEGRPGQKAARRKPSEDSFREVMIGLVKSCWDRLSKEKHKILTRKAFLQRIDEIIWNTILKCSEANWFQDFASQGDTSEAIWNFLWHIFSSGTLVTIIRRSLSLLMEELNSEEHQAGSRRGFLMSTAILYYLLDYEGDVLERILKRACKDAEGDDWQHFKDTLKNTSSTYYDETGNYHVPNKILIYAMRDDNSFLVSKILGWGAQPQVSLDPDFFTALAYVIRNDRKEILRILFVEQFANAADDEGMTALHVACRDADAIIVEMILQYGGKPDVPDKRGRLPLHYAVMCGKKETVRILFDKCHSKEQFANAADDEGMTALHLAFRDADASIVEMILQYGGKPDVPDKRGRLPLHYAVMYGRKENLRILFDKCHSKEQFANAADDEGKTALHWACRCADMNIVQMILQCRGKPDVPDKAGRLPLHYAVISGKKETVRSLFDECQSKEQVANAADNERMTLLHFACLYADINIVEMILQYRGKPDVPNKRGRLPLHYAVENRRKEIVKSLFDRCQSKERFANAADNEGMTALHLACLHADINIVEMILQYRGKPDVSNKSGRLPLHYAVDEGREDIVDVLIGRGNSDTVKDNDDKMVTRKDKDEMSPLDLVLTKNNMKLFWKLLSVSKQLLESYFDKVDSAYLLREFASEGNSQIVEKLLEMGADPRACDGRYRTALHHASMLEDENKAFHLSQLVLAKCTSAEERKILVEQKDDSGETALHLAAIKGHANLCHYFCLSNEDIINVKDANGRGLLYEVVERSDHDNPDIIECLLRFWKGGVESIIDHSDLTLLHVAASAGRKFIADFLIQCLEEAKVRYLRTPDILGQTALHKAAKGGHADTVTVLLYRGADPLLERDSDGRTALHCAVQNEDQDQAIAVAELLLKKCGSDEKKLILLWASAAGLGTPDQQLSDSPVKQFLVQQKKNIAEKLEKEGKKNNLLRTAACLGDTAMTKELLTRGAHFGDIRDQHWINSLKPKEKQIVNTVCRQIQIIAEQGNDQPAKFDNLGRSDFAYGLAALLLNPYLKPPITVGISGSWGMGKSSLMIQTEAILLKATAQLSLLPSETTHSSFPGIQILELSEKGENKYQETKAAVDLLYKETNLEKKLFWAFKHKISKCWMNVTNKKKTTDTKKGGSLSKFLNQYEPEHHHIFKSLAAMDSSYMFRPKNQQTQSEIDSPTEESVPAILTVRYNAWKYRNESEALAGMAMEITKEMEGIMTDAQWVSTCLRNTWRKQKQAIWIEILFPCLLAVLLAISFTWIVWLLLDRYKIKESVELKYASFPVSVVIMVWTLLKKVMRTVNPVSVQLMNYMKLPDHTEKLGYQERVISDITFLKEEISKRPYFLCTVASYIWRFIISLLSSKYRGEILPSSIPSANLRTIVFVDDIDRCQESVILQVLSAINLVLAVCQISVVLGMDKALIQRAIMKKYGDKSLKNSRQLADKYLQKIIQLPLDLPDPSEDQSKIFLDRHLGVFQKESKEGLSESQRDTEDDSIPEIDAAYHALFSPLENLFETRPNFREMLGSVIPIPATEEPVTGTQTTDTKDIAISVQQSSEMMVDASNSRQTGPIQTLRQTILKVAKGMQCINLFKTGHIQTNLETEAPQEANVAEGDQSLNDSIPIRQMLFMTYSKGEQNVFDYFQKMATDIRKLPREWKRLLNYHRLVWNIFLINNEAKHLDGWQVQLITWIFICWEWEENINIIIENWDRLRDIEEREPSLRMIVDHFIKSESEKKGGTARTSENSVQTDTTPQNLEGEKKEKGVSTNKEDLESSHLEPSKLKVVKDQMIEVTESQGDASNATFPNGRNEESALKKEVSEIKKQLDRNEKLLEKLKEQVDSIVNQRQVQWNEKSAKEKKSKSESWGRLKFALQRYDVSMNGIRAFQRFRFYCVAGYLPWPLPDRKIADI